MKTRAKLFIFCSDKRFMKFQRSRNTVSSASEQCLSRAIVNLCVPSYLSIPNIPYPCSRETPLNVSHLQPSHSPPTVHRNFLQLTTTQNNNNNRDIPPPLSLSCHTHTRKHGRSRARVRRGSDGNWCVSSGSTPARMADLEL